MLKLSNLPQRRDALRALCASGLAFVCGSTLAAEDYPHKVIQLVIPFPPGGAIDPILRPFMDAVARDLGQPIVVINRPGGGGISGAAGVAMMDKADGYTMGVMHNSVIRAPLTHKVSWDPLRDFTYLAGLFALAPGITVAVDAPWKNLSELLADAKARPGQISWGNVGATSANLIYAERLAKLTGVQFNMIPFKGGAESFQALIGHHLDVVGDPGFGPHVKSGSVRLLATFTAKRLDGYPDTPTVKELGFDLVIQSVIGLVAPKQLDPKIAERLAAALRRASTDAVYVKQLAQLDMYPSYMTSEEYTEYAIAQFQREVQMLAEIGFKRE